MSRGNHSIQESGVRIQNRGSRRGLTAGPAAERAAKCIYASLTPLLSALLFCIALFTPSFTSADPLDDWHSLSGGGYRAVYGSNTFVAVSGNNLLTSPDGVEWTLRSSGTTKLLNGIAYGNNTFVAVGAGGTILTSTNGVIWTARLSGTTNSLVAIAYGNNRFVVVAQAGMDGKTMFASEDGVTWTSHSGPFVSSNTNPLAYGGNTFVLASAGTIRTSPDGITWTSRSSSSLRRFFSSIRQ